MPVDPEPTPKRTKPEGEDDGERDKGPLRVVAKPLEEELLLPLRRLLLVRRGYRGCGASILRRAALAVLRTSRHWFSPLSSVAGLAVDDRLEHSVGRAAEDDGRRGILDRVVGASRERDDRQVGALAGRQGTHLIVDSQRAGRLDGRRAQNIGRQAGRRGGVRGPARRRSPSASPRRRRRKESRPGSRCRARLHACSPQRPRPVRYRSRAGRSTVGSARRHPAVGEQRDLLVRRPRRSARRAGPGRAPARAWRRRAGRSARPEDRAARRRAVLSPCSSQAFSSPLSARWVPTGIPSEGTTGRCRASRSRARAARPRSATSSVSRRGRLASASYCRSASAGSTAKTSR